MLTCKTLLLGEFSEALKHQVFIAFSGIFEPRGLSIAFGCLSTSLGIYISLRLLPVEL